MLVSAELYPSWNKHSAESQPVGWVTCSLAACRWRRQCRSQPNEVPSAGLTTQRVKSLTLGGRCVGKSTRTPILPICGVPSSSSLAPRDWPIDPQGFGSRCRPPACDKCNALSGIEVFRCWQRQGGVNGALMLLWIYSYSIAIPDTGYLYLFLFLWLYKVWSCS